MARARIHLLPEQHANSILDAALGQLEHYHDSLDAVRRAMDDTRQQEPDEWLRFSTSPKLGQVLRAALPAAQRLSKKTFVLIESMVRDATLFCEQQSRHQYAVLLAHPTAPVFYEGTRESSWLSAMAKKDGRVSLSLDEQNAEYKRAKEAIRLAAHLGEDALLREFFRTTQIEREQHWVELLRQCSFDEAILNVGGAHANNQYGLCTNLSKTGYDLIPGEINASASCSYNRFRETFDQLRRRQRWETPLRRLWRGRNP